MNTIGERIKSLREGAGMTQADLSKALKARGVNANRVSISKWETNVFKPMVHPIKCMSELFGVSMDYIMDGIAISENAIRPDERAIIEAVRLRPRLAVLIDKANKCKDHQLEGLIDIVEILCDAIENNDKKEVKHG